MSKRVVCSRVTWLLLILSGVCVLTTSILATPSPNHGRNRRQTIRAVRLGAATLSPTTISANGTAFGTVPASATITVSVATSSDVVEGTVATVDLTEDSNPNRVSYTVSGGQRNDGLLWDVTLRGGGVSETIRYTITGNATSVSGAVQFRVNLRSATNPPNTPPPAAVTEQPTTLAQGLLLTFQSPPPSGGGEEECDPYCQGGFGVTSGDPQTNNVDPCCIQTPIVIDIDGDGFSLTNKQDGVDFDFNNDGYANRIAWTAADSDDAWLVLDRNADDRITLGAELFGNNTPQPPSKNRNGFLALAEFDKPLDGGNGDGLISENDEVFARLRLWQDTNHNGVSEPAELHTLPDLGVTKIELRYTESRRTDEHGNQFRYRAKVWGSRGQTGRWAWDVFLTRAP